MTQRAPRRTFTSVSGARITVLLADDSVIVREGVEAMLAREPDLEVVGEAGDCQEVIARARSLEPDVLVADIRMGPALAREGIDAAREVRKKRAGTGVVILSQYLEPARQSRSHPQLVGRSTTRR